MNQIVKIVCTVLFASALCACGSADRLELDGDQEYAVQSTEIELLESTQEYRRAIAKNYLLLVGKYNEANDVLSAELAEDAVGKLRGYSLSYGRESDLYELSPKLFPEDPTLEIDHMLSLTETNNVAPALPKDNERLRMLMNLSEYQKAEEGAVVRGTELWIRPLLQAALKHAKDSGNSNFAIWDIENSGLVGTWYAVSGDVEIRAGKLTLELWGILPKWGWATASIDLETKEITLIHNDMMFE